MVITTLYWALILFVLIIIVTLFSKRLLQPAAHRDAVAAPSLHPSPPPPPLDLSEILYLSFLTPFHPASALFLPSYALLFVLFYELHDLKRKYLHDRLRLVEASPDSYSFDVRLTIVNDFDDCLNIHLFKKSLLRFCLDLS
jgi:hypothetical protein